MFAEIIAVILIGLAGVSAANRPINPGAIDYMQKGLVLAKQGKLNAAEKQYLLAIRSDTQFAAAYSNLGICYYKQNALKLAEQMFNQALELDSTLIEAKQNLGIIYYSRDKVQEAINLWQEILDENLTYFDRPRLHLFIGIAYLYSPEIACVDSFISEAIWQFDSALGIDSNFAEAHFWKAKASELIPDLPGAIAEYRTATALNPKYGEAYNQWGVLLFRDTLYSDAWDKFNKAIYCDPNNAIFHYNLGLTYMVQKMHFEGQKEIQKAYKLNPHLEASSQPIIIQTKPVSQNGLRDQAPVPVPPK